MGRAPSSNMRNVAAEDLPGRLRPVVVVVRLGAATAVGHVAPSALAVACRILEQPVTSRAVFQPVLSRGRHNFGCVENDWIEHVGGPFWCGPGPGQLDWVDLPSTCGQLGDDAQGTNSARRGNLPMREWSKHVGDDPPKFAHFTKHTIIDAARLKSDSAQPGGDVDRCRQPVVFADRVGPADGIDKVERLSPTDKLVTARIVTGVERKSFHPAKLTIKHQLTGELRYPSLTVMKELAGDNRTQPVGRRPPPHVWFVGSAVFHYLGPSFAVLLFARVSVGGVAWLRIVSAAIVFAVWRRPWRTFFAAARTTQQLMVALGVVFALMNYSFYTAIDRLPLGTVAAIEFVGPILLALTGCRTRRNLAALALAASGVFLLTNVRFTGDPVAFAWAAANAILFTAYIVLAHRVSRADHQTSPIDRLGASMIVAAIAVTPIGFVGAVHTLADPTALAAGIGVGVSSSVIPYVATNSP